MYGDAHARWKAGTFLSPTSWAPVWHLIYRLTLLSEQETYYGGDLCLGFSLKTCTAIYSMYLNMCQMAGEPHVLMQTIYVCCPLTFWCSLVFVLCVTFDLP